ncbi:hypothetical protein [Photobacterium damselae]|uniref:hypothetical protein n=1 Tax=Photobacterium damselae TaxID=38293 RepID=UPI001F22E284|nr:hypothetical protein [Photobacterium damselae]UKA12800.1 hypothetical protein IHC91_21140 [Photobacterium damselae subsp. damselae]
MRKNPKLTIVDVTELALVADMSYEELFSSKAFNRKMLGVVSKGIHRGFNHKIMGGFTVQVGDSLGKNTAVVERDDYCLTIQGQKPIDIEIPKGKSAAVIEGFYQLGIKTTQVDTESTYESATIKVLTLDAVEDHHIVLFTADVPADATELTEDMLSTDDRTLPISNMDYIVVDLGFADLSSGVYPAPAIDSNNKQHSTWWRISKAGTVDGIEYSIDDTLFYSIKTGQYQKVGGTPSWEDIENKPKIIAISSNQVKASGQWCKLATVTMPQSSSSIILTVTNGVGFNVGDLKQLGQQRIMFRAGNNSPKGISIKAITDGGFSTPIKDIGWKATSGDEYAIYALMSEYNEQCIWSAMVSEYANIVIDGQSELTTTEPTGLTKGSLTSTYTKDAPPTAAELLPVSKKHSFVGGPVYAQGFVTETSDYPSIKLQGSNGSYGLYEYDGPGRAISLISRNNDGSNRQTWSFRDDGTFHSPQDIINEGSFTGNKAFLDQWKTSASFYAPNLCTKGETSAYYPVTKWKSKPTPGQWLTSSMGHLVTSAGVVATVIHSIDENGADSQTWSFNRSGTFESPGDVIAFNGATRAVPKNEEVKENSNFYPDSMPIDPECYDLIHIMRVIAWHMDDLRDEVNESREEVNNLKSLVNKLSLRLDTLEKGGES